ncbi:MAG: hypothetical protein UY73_C0051G0005 [Parcubacteria group bacterium GW2011_GWA2_52_8]|nr:MAG: hypothetical protein UY73_C0051G0005 [Parcubacteria group bacterium GW2011_GWA2_52_8]
METPALFEEKSWLEKLRFVFWIVLILAVAVLLYVFSRGQQLVIRDPGAFQAVFLDNGQVYFGKLRSVNRDLWSLTDIYYLRAGTLQQGSGGEILQGSIDLIKLGSEVHGPRDEMLVNRDHVIFYEDLGADGEVMKLIEQHKARSQ